MRDFLQASLTVLRRTAWAPVLVLLAHHFIRSSTWRQPLDFAMHFSGGMAMGYCMLVAIQALRLWLGESTLLGRVIFAFCAALTIGVFWEFAELASDVFLGTHIQKSIWETMRDLIADSTGAALALGICLAQPRFRRP